MADHAEVARYENKTELQKLQEQLLAERQHAKSMERRLKQLQESSFRHTEQLAKELDMLKSTSGLSSDSEYYS